MDVEGWREEFPILAEKTYLNSCSLGALSRRVRGAVERHLDTWQANGAPAWYGPWLDELARCRQRFARLINADEDEVALLPNVSSALASVTSGLDTRDRDDVVLTAMDFPTVGHAFHARPDTKVTLVPSPDGIHVPPDAIEASLDDRTAALVTSHVFYASGAVQDVQRLCKAARSVGAISVIDAYQGTGQLPTDVKAIGCDVLVTGGLKWLLGGTGISYMYVSRSAQERLQPRVAGWFGERDQFAFDITRFEPREDARRYEMGTPALPSVFAGSEGLALVHELGPVALRERQTLLVNELVERLEDAGFTLRTPADPDERAGIVMVAHEDPPGVVAALAKRRIVVDQRPGRVRISPYFYNTSDELLATVDALRNV